MTGSVNPGAVGVQVVTIGMVCTLFEEQMVEVDIGAVDIELDVGGMDG